MAMIYHPRMQMLAVQLKHFGYVSPESLASALRINGGGPVPPIVQTYNADLLMGKIRKPKGRPSMGHSERDDLIVYLYDRYLTWLTKWKDRLDDVPSWIKRADFWQGPPAEKAARMVARAVSRQANGRYDYKPLDYSSVLNVVSKTKKRYALEKAKGTHQPYWRSEVDRWIKSDRESQSQKSADLLLA